MSTYDQLGFHIFQNLHTHVLIYEDDTLITEYMMPIHLVELDFYMKDLLNTFEEKTKKENASITLQKFIESECVFASLRHDNLRMIIGPFLDNDFQINTLNQMKLKLKIDAHRMSALNQFYEELKVLLPNDIKFIYQLLKSYEPYNLDTKINMLRSVKLQKERELPKENLNELRLFIKHNYAFEDKLMLAIEKGDQDGVKDALNSLSSFYLPDRLPKDTLRNTKNKMIILNSISTRAAIRGGLDMYHAHELSTKIGIEIEQMKTHSDQDKMSFYILMSFANAVKEYQTKGYPELVRQTYLYIYRNLKEPFLLSDIADSLYVTKEHLSRTFKKATGKTIQEVMMDYKILEAKKLIEQHELSLIDISDMLCFSSSAHFSTAFKKKVGITPKDYKKQVSV